MPLFIKKFSCLLFFFLSALILIFLYFAFSTFEEVFRPTHTHLHTYIHTHALTYKARIESKRSFVLSSSRVTRHNKFLRGKYRFSLGPFFYSPFFSLAFFFLYFIPGMLYRCCWFSFFFFY